ncbi:MAG: histidine triad nucleotide-binding protein [Candidatus Kryptoniota bacterium]
MSCVFCNIIEGKSKGEFVYQDDEVVVIKDAFPKAPVHLLVIPKKHIPTLLDVEFDANGDLPGKMVMTAIKVANDVGLSEKGFRLVWNVRMHGGQTVNHIHLHILGGRQMKWPPG